MTDKQPYMRWHPAKADSMDRGTELDGLNAGTLALIHEHALEQNKYMMPIAEFVAKYIDPALKSAWSEHDRDR